MLRGLYIWGFLYWCCCIPAAAQDRADILHRAQKAVTAVIVHDIFSPPVASRIYLYSSLAAYEAGNIENGARSFSLLHNDFRRPETRKSRNQIDPAYASIYAMMYAASRFVFSETAMLDSLNVVMESFKGLSREVKENSIRWSREISDSVVHWSGSDNYGATRKMRRYTVLKQPSAWKPTPPGYFAAVEPHWGRMKTVCIDNIDSCRPETPINYSNEKDSPFYSQAMEVYKASNRLSSTDSAVAMFWDCNPFFLNTQGHMNFAVKKLSPGGHWMSIAGIACKKKNADISSSLGVYLAVSIALYDAFISCWDEKYRSNVVRPESFINSFIDENWRPLLQTPPFPEYTSGHSVISSSAATVLTSIFGDHFEFSDDTEVAYGLPTRNFNSFSAAANEAASSRFYGGIHYMQSIEEGLIQGQRIGKIVTAKLDPLIKKIR